MTEFVSRVLFKHGFEPVIAHYEPYSETPRLSVPSFRLLTRSVGSETRAALDGYECHAIGAWLPELEFTHYLATGHWKQVMNSCDAHIAVSGNVLAATPFWQTGRPYLAWVATDWDGDRKERVKSFPWPRRMLDKAVNGPVTRRLQAKLLNSGRILPLSQYTSRMLSLAAGRNIGAEVMPSPVDIQLFAPGLNARVPGRIGFAGRFDDPRKNVGLLLESVARLRRDGVMASVVLVGGRPTGAILRMVGRLKLDGAVEFVLRLAKADLARCLRSFDVFALPSHQEGLCIAALEAMACEVPVVSTRCGGPEEFVIDGETGYLVDSAPERMAEAIRAIVGSPSLRARLAGAGRRLVQKRYGVSHAEDVFLNAFWGVFPQLQPG